MDYGQFESVRHPPAAPALTATTLYPPGVTPPPAPAVTAAAPEAPAPAAPAPTAPVAVEPEDAPRFVGGRLREMTHRLDFPVEFRGKLYEAITLRRPNAAEVGLWFERLAAATAIDPNASLHFPIFLDDTGQPVPVEVLDFLDGEDDERIMEASADFLPPRLRRMQEAAAALARSAGAATGPKSSS